MFEHAACEVEETVEGCVEHTVPFVVSHHEHHVVVTDAGVVDEDGDIVIGMRVLPVVHSFVDSFFVGNVERHELSLAAFSLNELLYLQGFRFIGAVVDDDGLPHLCQAQGYGSADTARGACD